MVAVMGKFGSVASRNGSSAESHRYGPTLDGLEHDGTMAVLGRNSPDGSWHDVLFPSNARESHRLLTELLRPLETQPEKLATRLLRRFGSISAITDASAAELAAANVYGDRWLEPFLAVRNLLHLGLQQRVKRTRLDPANPSLHRYLISSMRGLKRERMVAFFADLSGFIITEEIVGEGDEGALRVSLREVLGTALKVEARRILLAHNHPSGSPEPSRLDIQHTRSLADQGKRLGVLLEDHIIVGRSEVVSMKTRGLM